MSSTSLTFRLKLAGEVGVLKAYVCALKENVKKNEHYSTAYLSANISDVLEKIEKIVCDK